MTKTFGIMSDFHSVDIRVIIPAIKVFQKEGVDALILNGDIVGDRSGISHQDYLATILDSAGCSGLETFVQPGSHEEFSEFEPIVGHFTSKYSNLIDTFKNPKIESGGHDLIFLQGLDWRVGEASKHGYSLENVKESGLYQTKDGFLRIINLEDLRKYATNPEKTLVVSHVPRKFDDPEYAVDMAEFGEVMHPFQLGDSEAEVGSVFPGPVGLSLIKQGAPVQMKRQNRGNQDLKSLYEELGINKAVSGHFHESGHRANDTYGNPVEECRFVDELFYNASYMDGLKMGMISIDDGKIAYERVDLREHIR